MSHHRPFGKFAHVGTFLNHFKTQQSQADSAAIAAQPVDQTIAQMKAESLNKPNIAEVKAQVVVFEGNVDSHSGPHQHIIVKVTELVDAGAAVQADVEDSVATGAEVFVAIHYGDNMGLPAPIPGIVPGLMLHMQGIWITKDQAHAQDGEKMAVLHFTHHPDGFTCTPDRCYR